MTDRSWPCGSRPDSFAGAPIRNRPTTEEEDEDEDEEDEEEEEEEEKDTAANK